MTDYPTDDDYHDGDLLGSDSPERMCSKGTWKTADKTVLNIEDMTDVHILNTLKYLILAAKHTKHLEDKKMCSYPSLQGDIAQYHAEQAFDEQMHTIWEDYLSPEFWDIWHEALHRKLITEFKWKEELRN